jgi:transposase
MTNKPVEVITSVQRRRRWSSEEKRRIVAAAIEPGAVASEVARAAGIHVSQLFRWRQQLCGPARDAPAFSPVAVVGEPAASSMIEVEFANGARMRIAGAADGAMVSAIIKALAKEAGRR